MINFNHTPKEVAMKHACSYRQDLEIFEFKMFAHMFLSKPVLKCFGVSAPLHDI